VLASLGTRFMSLFVTVVDIHSSNVTGIIDEVTSSSFAPAVEQKAGGSNLPELLKLKAIITAGGINFQNEELSVIEEDLQPSNVVSR
jgi:hypothetical protein